MKVTRADVVQTLLDRFESPRYLEIGVQNGNTFHAVRAGTKVAVDPDFRFDTAEALRANAGATYFETTSDVYFAEHADGAMFDVIYIDGLHTFEQTLRDLMNSLSHVHERSLIAIDDIYPNSIAAALPDFRQSREVRRVLNISSAAWMGDVYKLVLFIDSFMPAWDFRCVSNNHGQLIMWRSPRNEPTERLVSGIGAAGYERAVIERPSFRFARLGDIMTAVDAARKPNRDESTAG